METPPIMGRRAFLLTAAGAGLAIAGLVGCTDGSPKSQPTIENTGSAASPSTEISTSPSVTSGNPFNEVIKGVAVASTLTYESGQYTTFMTQEHVDERMSLIKDDLDANGIRLLIDPTVTFGPQDAPDFSKSTDEWLKAADWTQYDRIIGAAKQHGLKILANIGYWPTPFVEPGCQDTETANGCLPAPAYLEKFAAFCAAVAERYDITTFQIENEVNTIAADGTTPNKPKYYKSPREYAVLFNMASTAIKAVNSEAAVAVSALAGVSDEQRQEGALDPGDFLDEAIKAGMRGFDAVTINAYGSTANDIEGPSDQRTLVSVMNDAAHNTSVPGLKNMPVVITEFGAPANATQESLDAQSTAIQESLQAKYTKLTVFGRYVYTLYDSYDTFGLYAYDPKTDTLAPKPAVKTFRETPINTSR